MRKDANITRPSRGSKNIFLWWSIVFILAGFLLGSGISFFFLREPVADARARTQDFSPNAVWINGGWKEAPLITWCDDLEENGFILVSCNDMMGNIEVYKMWHEDFVAVMHATDGEVE